MQRSAEREFDFSGPAQMMLCENWADDLEDDRGRNNQWQQPLADFGKFLSRQQRQSQGNAGLW